MGGKIPDEVSFFRDAPENSRQVRLSEIDLLVSNSVGVSHRRCKIYNNQAYCPHHSAKMFNCDQAIPDFEMNGLLRFSDCL